MNNNFDFRYILSYLGSLPYIIILLDKTFFGQIQNNIINDFYIYYSLIIIFFIGAINWSLKDDISNFLAVYGTLPSILGIIIIILQIFSFSYLISTFFLIIFILFQLIVDYFFIYDLNNNKKIFFKLRLPLSMFICFCLTTNLTEF